MPPEPKFILVFAPETFDHLDAIERKHHGLIERTLDEQLGHAPECQTRNRKPLEQPSPFGATWELRLGPGNRFRVFYEVDRLEKTVHILAIGWKDRNRLFIAGKEIEL
jgi:hypothetical protein